jgi:hypothetical protein
MYMLQASPYVVDFKGGWSSGERQPETRRQVETLQELMRGNTVGSRQSDFAAERLEWPMFRTVAAARGAETRNIESERVQAGEARRRCNSCHEQISCVE